MLDDHQNGRKALVTFLTKDDAKLYYNVLNSRHVSKMMSNRNGDPIVVTYTYYKVLLQSTNWVGVVLRNLPANSTA